MTEIVVMTIEPADQNVDNVQIISEVMLETASLLDQTFMEGNLEPNVIETVSCNMLLSSSFQLCKDKYG